MLKKLLFILIAITSFNLSAQDTTWVQTFTFDTIATRRADFVFPQSLNGQRFEKVLMYYKLKCDPQTPWDSYNCGEWDYLAYTRVFDHTGVMDSVQVDSIQYLNNYTNSGTFNYEPWGTNRRDTLIRIENQRSGATTALSNIVMTPTGTATYPFDLSKNGSRFQMLVSATELTNSGVVAGDIQSLALYINSITVSGEVLYPTISIKGTTDNSITNFHSSGFTEVYNLSRSISGFEPEFATGINELLFHTPFTWNGTDNLIIEFTFERTLSAMNMISFDTESSISDMAMNYSGRNGVLNFDGTNHALFELSDVDMGNDVTIAFWAKGLGNTGVNTSILEAYDTLNNRVMNVHMPWSNNRMYWDCGEGNGYDRIDSDMSAAGIDNEWHHWAFIKNQGTGEMKIMRDGVLWHSGTGLTRPIGYMHRLIIGANLNRSNHWKGMVDEFQLYNVAIDEATITAWYQKRIDNSHPNWNDLMVYYDFDENEWAEDRSQNNYLLMPSSKGMFDFSEYPVAGFEASVNRPLLDFGQGVVSGVSVDQEVNYLKVKEPEVVFEFAPIDHHFEIIDAFVATAADTENTYDAAGTVVSSTPFAGSDVISNQSITYYQAPYEIINDVEIGRYITPYGIQFDLGPQGFSWIYDVTDYQMYLKDTVDLAAHNTQELIDLRFAFIEGIPPRDVHKREPIWSDWKSYNYGNLDNDVNLQSTSILLSDTSSMFKIKTRLTGHGQVGNGGCCEWAPKTHSLSVDGTNRFNWSIWQTNECGDNPNVSQGGTWPYAREGWCPGDVVRENDHDLTPYVTPGNTVTLDYDISDVPAGDPGQAGGNYVVAMDLISYSAPNFQNDAAIIDILNPNEWEYYGKWNPSCQNPRVIIQNTGEQPLTSAKITVWVDYNHPVVVDWVGNLAFLEKEVVEIPITDFSFWYDYNSSGTFTANVTQIQNTWGLDEYAQNNEKTVRFEAPDAINGQFLVWFTTNNKAYENRWKLMDSDGNTIFERTSLSNSTQYKDTFDLAPGCYSILLEDNDSDGISFWYSAQTQGETAGNFVIKLVGGPIIEYFEKDFGNFNRYNFTVGFDLGIDDLPEVEEVLNVYPNPNNGLFDIEISGNINFDAQLRIYDIMGREVLNEKMNAKSDFADAKIDLSHVNAGHYIVKVITKQGVYTKEFVKQ